MRLSPKLENLAVSLIVLAFFIAVLVWTQGFAEPSGRQFPTLVSTAAIVLCLIDLLAQTNTGVGRRIAAVLPGSIDIDVSELTRGLHPEAIALLWISGATALMVLCGFLIGIPAYVFCYMTLHARRPLGQAVFAALLTIGAIWLAFQQLLSYELYRGVLFTD